MRPWRGLSAALRCEAAPTGFGSGGGGAGVEEEEGSVRSAKKAAAEKRRTKKLVLAIPLAGTVRELDAAPLVDARAEDEKQERRRSSGEEEALAMMISAAEEEELVVNGRVASTKATASPPARLATLRASKDSICVRSGGRRKKREGKACS